MNPSDDAQKLFVAGLPDSVTEEVLRDLFAESGVQTLDVSLPRDRMSGRPRGFAFVRLSSPEDVDRALSQLDGTIVGDSSISVRRFKAEAPNRDRTGAPGGPGASGPRPGGGGRGPAADTSDRTLYVGNLPYDVTQEEVESVLRSRGAEAIVRVHLPLDPDGRRRGFGFVTLGSADAARAAVDQLQGATVRGRTLTVNAALPKPAGGPRPDRAYNSPTNGGSMPGASAGPPANRFGPPAKPGGKNDFTKRKKSEGDGGGRGAREKRGGEASWQNNHDDD